MGGLFSFMGNMITSAQAAIYVQMGYTSAYHVAKFLAWKAILFILVTVGTVFAASLVLEFVFTEIYTYVGNQMTQTSVDGNLNLTLSTSGYFAYFIDVLRIDDAMRILVSALTLKIILKFTPFLRF